MNRRPTSNTLLRSYEDFVPSSSVIQDAGLETLVINLPDFKKEQVRVQIDSFGNLKITGERPLVGSAQNKWSRFRKDYRIPSNCNPNEIRAKFENGVLNVMMPKPIPKQEPPAPQPIPDPVQNKPDPKQEAPAAPTPSPSPTPKPVPGSKLPSPSPTQPTPKPATESKLPSPQPISDQIHALFQQMKDKLPTPNQQAPSTSLKPTTTTPTQPTQKPDTESKLPSIPKPISEPIHALMQQIKDKFPTPMPQVSSTSLEPTETTPTQPGQEPTTESRVSPVPGPTPLVQPIPKESVTVPTPAKVSQQSHQYPTTNDDKTTHSPPSQVSSTPIPEITHRKKPDGESSNVDNNHAADQRTQENIEKIAKGKEEKKRKYVDAAEEMKGKKSSTENGDHGNSGGSGRTLEDFIEGLAMELKKPTTQLVVNAVVASMVVVGLITWTLKSSKRT